MCSPNPSFKKTNFTFKFFEQIPKKFSSIHLFFLLFGFFLGNLSPQGLFFPPVMFASKLANIPLWSDFVTPLSLSGLDSAEIGERSSKAELNYVTNFQNPVLKTSSSPVSKMRGFAHGAEQKAKIAQIQSIPFLFSFRRNSSVIEEKIPSDLKESTIHEKTLSSFSTAAKKNGQTSFTNPMNSVIVSSDQNPIERDNKLNQFSETKRSWSLIGIFNSFPGPAPTILLWSEIFNWLSFRVFSFLRKPFENDVKKNPTLFFFQKKRKENKKSVFLGLEALQWNQTFSASKLINKKERNEENAQFYESNLQFFFRSLNSVKIGFLLGIFVDAFKVGS